MYLQERSIGPSLGADSIHQGIMAGIAGLLAVVVVMLMYYKRSGLNAVLALVLNTILLLAAISYFHAVLTLPGIAGIILTIGMAVDSNVLIFERIREELRSGKSVIAAVDTGFGKAWWTIVDTHVTTVVSCAFLFLFRRRAGAGFCGNIDDRSDRKYLHRGFRVEDDLRLRTVRSPPAHGAEHLSPGI